MHIEWLNKKITIEEAEARFMAQNERIGPNPVPFGFYNHQWNQLKSELQDNDELWMFSSPKETWQNLCGRAGICIVRDGEIYKSLVKVVN